MKEIKIGLIGLGTLAEKVHLKNLLSMDHVLVEAISDIDEERVWKIADEHNIKHVYTDSKEMLGEITLDCVIISTPNSTHMELATRAIEHGVHVFIEKPIGTDLQEVENFIEAAKEKNILTMVGMPFRFRRDVGIAKDYLSEGKLGKIYYTKAKLKRKRGTPTGWFTNKLLSGGGVLMDVGVHMLDLSWYLLGQPKAKSISGHALTALGNYETKYISSWQSANQAMNPSKVFDVDDFSSAWIRFEDGSVLSLEVSWALNGEEEDFNIQIYGTEGGLTLNPLTIYEEDDGLFMTKTPSFNPNNMFLTELEHFIKSIREDTETLVDAEQGYEVLQMLNHIYKSSELQKEIDLNNN